MSLFSPKAEPWRRALWRARQDLVISAVDFRGAVPPDRRNVMSQTIRRYANG
ncbi:hypothetical protein [Labrys okinawensis]|uniref:hypothetical protein n=1 Tax=Labrys okinawensis TaxID=346911 RepID=UPI0015E450B5|nr:hypothetical protein [Labrys okinawensis]